VGLYLHGSLFTRQVFRSLSFLPHFEDFPLLQL
jgi:hypothetical protein